MIENKVDIGKFDFSKLRKHTEGSSTSLCVVFCFAASSDLLSKDPHFSSCDLCSQHEETQHEHS